MSSGITKTDQIAYVGLTPWHSLGNQVPEDVSVEEMIVAANLGWPIEIAPLFFTIDGKQHLVPERVMYRGDTNDVLDVVGPIYEPAQNTEVLEFFRDYLATGDLKLNTAGSLWGGKYVWGLAKLKVGFTLPGGDQVEGYLLVANANKYGRGLIVKFVLERVVCHNTLSIALSENGRQVTIAHNRKFDADARRDAQQKLGLAVDTFKNLEKEAQTFAKHKLTDDEVNRVLGITFDLKLDEEEIYVENRRATRVRELYEGAAIGADLKSATGTSWGLLNSVTQYMDHEAGRSQDTRLRNAWFGGGETIKNRARKALWDLEKKGK
jgi:phage/plasmid-like protein (TIGR03299 family)